MSGLKPFPDSTLLALDLVDLLLGDEDALPGAESDLPTADELVDPADGRPKTYAQAFAWGGDQERLNNYPTIDVSFFAHSYVEASRLATKFETALMEYPHRVESSGRTVVVDSVEVVTPTVEVPWLEESTTRRFQGTYTLSVRR